MREDGAWGSSSCSQEEAGSDSRGPWPWAASGGLQASSPAAFPAALFSGQGENFSCPRKSHLPRKPSMLIRLLKDTWVPLLGSGAQRWFGETCNPKHPLSGDACPCLLPAVPETKGWLS